MRFNFQKNIIRYFLILSLLAKIPLFSYVHHVQINSNSIFAILDCRLLLFSSMLILLYSLKLIENISTEKEKRQQKGASKIDDNNNIHIGRMVVE